MSEKDKPSTSKVKNAKDVNPESEIPPNLNILSDNFDPVEALYSDNIKKPSTRIKQYNNITDFESALKRLGIQQVGKLQLTENLAELNKSKELAKTQTSTNAFTSASTSERRFQEHQMPIKGKPPKVRHTRNLLKKMEDHKKGPLSVLYNLWQSQQKVIIYVRKEHGIRGYVYGYLVAFDQHTNILIKNGYEIWKRRKFKFSQNNALLGMPANCSARLNKLGIKLPETEFKSVDRKYVVIKKKIDQLVIRGEQVCLIRAANTTDEEKLEKCIL